MGALIALLVGALSPASAQDTPPKPATPAEETEAKPEAVKTEYVWVATEAGKVVGVERMKAVLSPTGKRYISVEVVPEKGTDAVRVTSFHERDPDGTLRKYFRKNDVRLGKGIRAFRRGVGIRMVGINQKKMEPVEIPKASEHHIWDPVVLAGLAVWVELASSAGEVSFRVMDVSQRTSVTARVAPVEAATLGDPDGHAATLQCWKAWAGGAEIATLCGDGAGSVISVKAGRRAILLEGWTWEVPQPAPVDEDAAPAETPTGEGADAPPDEPGVGP